MINYTKDYFIRERMDFLEKLQDAILRNNSLLCLGLDTDINKIPKHLLHFKDPVLEFNKAIINTTHMLVSSYKANIAYYTAHGANGLQSLIQTVQYIHDTYPPIPCILDAKRADIGSTSMQYVKEVFDVVQADAVTVNPYLGYDALEPFFKRSEKGIIILCKTSNPGAADFQDILIENEPLYLKVAKKIVEWNTIHKNCLMVVGATYTKEIKKIRAIAPNMFFLVPGIGAQGGDLEKTLNFGLTKEKSGLILHSARSILYASANTDFDKKARQKALETRNLINKFR